MLWITPKLLEVQRAADRNCRNLSLKCKNEPETSNKGAQERSVYNRKHTYTNEQAKHHQRQTTNNKQQTDETWGGGQGMRMTTIEVWLSGRFALCHEVLERPHTRRESNRSEIGTKRKRREKKKKDRNKEKQVVIQ